MNGPGVAFCESAPSVGCEYGHYVGPVTRTEIEDGTVKCPGCGHQLTFDADWPTDAELTKYGLRIDSPQVTA